MARVKDVYNCLNREIPFETQEEWDNSGLIIGNMYSEVKTIAVMLDATVENVEKAIKNNVDLIITHHPIIFDPVKSVLKDDPIYNLIKQNISVISAHTNWDKAEKGVNGVLAKVLELTDVKDLKTGEGAGFVKYGTLSAPEPESDFCKIVKEKLKAPVIKYASAHEAIRRVAVCGGSGGDFIDDVAEIVDAYITSDIKYHQFLHASEIGLTLIDAGHFSTEDISMGPLSLLLAQAFPDVKVLRLRSQDPVSYK